MAISIHKRKKLFWWLHWNIRYLFTLLKVLNIWRDWICCPPQKKHDLSAGPDTSEHTAETRSHKSSRCQNMECVTWWGFAFQQYPCAKCMRYEKRTSFCLMAQFTTNNHLFFWSSSSPISCYPLVRSLCPWFARENKRTLWSAFCRISFETGFGYHIICSVYSKHKMLWCRCGKFWPLRALQAGAVLWHGFGLTCVSNTRLMERDLYLKEGFGKPLWSVPLKRHELRKDFRRQTFQFPSHLGQITVASHFQDLQMFVLVKEWCVFY